MKNLLTLDNVHKTYHVGEVDVHALRGVDLKVRQGEFLAILGESGSGKSTLLNSVGCLDIPTKGKIHLANKDIQSLEESELAQIRGQKIGFIFQNYNLIPSLSALENVMLPMIFQHTEEAKRKSRAIELLNLVGLGHRMDHTPMKLSVDGNEYIMIKEKNKIKVKKIGEFVNKIIKNSKNLEKIKNIEEGVKSKVNHIQIATFNDNYNQEFTDLKYVIRHKTNEILEIKTEYGYKIKSTGAHSIFVYKNGKIFAKNVSELKEGDVLPISLDMPSESTFNNKEINFCNDLKKVKDKLVMEQNKIRFKGSRVKVNSKIKIDSKLCRILGDFVSEGCVRLDEENKLYYLTFTFNINEKKRVERLKNDFEKVFGLNLRIKHEINKNTTTLIATNKIISYIFKDYFKLGDKSWRRDFPDFIFNLSDDMKLDFLAGVYGDGTYRSGGIQGRREISIKTTSKVLANKLHFLLLQLGYLASNEENMPKQRAKRRVYRLVTYSKQCLKLSKELIKRDYNLKFLSMSNLGSDELIPNYVPMDNKLIGIIDSNRHLFTTKEFSGIGGVLRKDKIRVDKIRRDLLSHILNRLQLKDYKKIVDGNVGFVKIKSINTIKGERYVYDVTDENNRFIGTFGFYLHNSGGEQQRVAIARALSNDPEIILADEPTGNLDSETELDIINLLVDLHEKRKKTIIMITHNQKLAKYAERIIYLKDGKILK